jgi:hypothetical protein
VRLFKIFKILLSDMISLIRPDEQEALTTSDLTATVSSLLQKIIISLPPRMGDMQYKLFESRLYAIE